MGNARRRRKRFAVRIGIALLVLVAIGGGIWIVIQRHYDEQVEQDTVLSRVNEQIAGETRLRNMSREFFDDSWQVRQFMSNVRIETKLENANTLHISGVNLSNVTFTDIRVIISPQAFGAPLAEVVLSSLGPKERFHRTLTVESIAVRLGNQPPLIRARRDHP